MKIAIVVDLCQTPLEVFSAPFNCFKNVVTVPRLI
jgi:hypothetical protein